MSGVEGPRPPDVGAPGMPPAPAPAAYGSGPGPAPPVPPAGGAPYGYGPDLAGGRQNGERARTALWVGLVAFSLQAVCSVIVLASLSDFYRELFDTVGSGRRLTPAQTTPPTNASYLVASGLSQIAGIVALVVGILFLIWFHKALSNARALGLPLTRSPGWGVAGFFIPIVNLWFPYQSMRDLLPEGTPGRSLVGRWWACYLGASFLTSAAGMAAVFSPVVGIGLSVGVVGLYAIAAVTLRELISASTAVAEQRASSVAPPNLGWGTPTPAAPGAPVSAAPYGSAPTGPTGPAAPSGPSGSATGGSPAPSPVWSPPPAAPPKDPWNRT